MATDNPNELQKTAGDLLYSQVYIPTFFQKLASFGIQPQGPEQAESLLRQATMLRQLRAEDLVKQAADKGDPLLIAEQRLAERLGQLQSPEQNQAAMVEKYAAELVKARPELAEAAITYQNCEAQKILAQQAKS